MSVNITVNGKFAKCCKKPTCLDDAERVRREQECERRKLRLQQVREESKNLARKIRNDVAQEKERQLRKLEAIKTQELNCWRDHVLRRKTHDFRAAIFQVGAAHQAAQHERHQEAVRRCERAHPTESNLHRQLKVRQSCREPVGIGNKENACTSIKTCKNAGVQTAIFRVIPCEDKGTRAAKRKRGQDDPCGCCVFIGDKGGAHKCCIDCVCCRHTGNTSSSSSSTSSSTDSDSADYEDETLVPVAKPSKTKNKQETEDGDSVEEEDSTESDGDEQPDTTAIKVSKLAKTPPVIMDVDVDSSSDTIPTEEIKDKHSEHNRQFSRVISQAAQKTITNVAPKKPPVVPSTQKTILPQGKKVAAATSKTNKATTKTTKDPPRRSSTVEAKGKQAQPIPQKTTKKATRLSTELPSISRAATTKTPKKTQKSVAEKKTPQKKATTKTDVKGKSDRQYFTEVSDLLKKMDKQSESSEPTTETSSSPKEQPSRQKRQSPVKLQRTVSPEKSQRAVSPDKPQRAVSPEKPGPSQRRGSSLRLLSPEKKLPSKKSPRKGEIAPTISSTTITIADAPNRGTSSSDHVQYYDYNNKFTKQYPQPADVVSRPSVEENMLNAMELAKIERELQAVRDKEIERCRDKSVERGQLALEREQVRRSCNELTEKLEALHRQHPQLLPSDAGLYTHNRFSNAVARKQTKMNSAVEDMLLRPAPITCPEIDSQENIRNVGARMATLRRNIITCAEVDTQARAGYKQNEGVGGGATYRLADCDLNLGASNINLECNKSSSDSCCSILLGYVNDQTEQIRKDLKQYEREPNRNEQKMKRLQSLLERIEKLRDRLIAELEGVVTARDDENIQDVIDSLSNVRKEREDIAIDEIAKQQAKQRRRGKEQNNIDTEDIDEIARQKAKQHRRGKELSKMLEAKNRQLEQLRQESSEESTDSKGKNKTKTGGDKDAGKGSRNQQQCVNKPLEIVIKVQGECRQRRKSGSKLKGREVSITRKSAKLIRSPGARPPPKKLSLSQLRGEQTKAAKRAQTTQPDQQDSYDSNSTAYRSLPSVIGNNLDGLLEQITQQQREDLLLDEEHEDDGESEDVDAAGARSHKRAAERGRPATLAIRDRQQRELVEEYDEVEEGYDMQDEGITATGTRPQQRQATRTARNRPPPPHINPLVAQYVQRLLCMTRSSVKSLGVSSSDIETPTSSIINTSANITTSQPASDLAQTSAECLERIEAFIADNRSFINELEETLRSQNDPESRRRSFDEIWKRRLLDKSIKLPSTPARARTDAHAPLQAQPSTSSQQKRISISSKDSDGRPRIITSRDLTDNLTKLRESLTDQRGKIAETKRNNVSALGSGASKQKGNDTGSRILATRDLTTSQASKPISGEPSKLRKQRSSDTGSKISDKPMYVPATSSGINKQREGDTDRRISTIRELLSQGSKMISAEGSFVQATGSGASRQREGEAASQRTRSISAIHLGHLPSSSSDALMKTGAGSKISAQSQGSKPITVEPSENIRVLATSQVSKVTPVGPTHVSGSGTEGESDADSRIAELADISKSPISQTLKLTEAARSNVPASSVSGKQKTSETDSRISATKSSGSGKLSVSHSNQSKASGRRLSKNAVTAGASKSAHLSPGRSQVSAKRGSTSSGTSGQRKSPQQKQMPIDSSHSQASTLTKKTESGARVSPTRRASPTNGARPAQEATTTGQIGTLPVTQTGDQQQQLSPDGTVQERSQDRLSNYSRMVNNCENRIAELTELINKVRAEKLRLVEVTLSSISGEGEANSTSYLDLPEASGGATDAERVLSEGDRLAEQSPPTEPVSSSQSVPLDKNAPTGTSRDSGINMSRPMTAQGQHYDDDPDSLPTTSNQTQQRQLEQQQHRPKPPPTLSRYSPYLEDEVVHELSTIVEVDTPGTSHVNISIQAPSSAPGISRQLYADLHRYSPPLYPTFEQYMRQLNVDLTMIDPDQTMRVEEEYQELVAAMKEAQAKGRLEPETFPTLTTYMQNITANAQDWDSHYSDENCVDTIEELIECLRIANLTIRDFPTPREYMQRLRTNSPNAEYIDTQSLGHLTEETTDDTESFNIEQELKRRQILQHSFRSMRATSTACDGYAARVVTTESGCERLSSSDSPSSNIETDLRTLGLQWPAAMLRKMKECDALSSSTTTTSPGPRRLQAEANVRFAVCEPREQRQGTVQLQSPTTTGPTYQAGECVTNLRDFLTRELLKHATSSDSSSTTDESLRNHFLNSIIDNMAPTAGTSSGARQRKLTSTPVESRSSPTRTTSSSPTHLFSGESHLSSVPYQDCSPSKRTQNDGRPRSPQHPRSQQGSPRR